SSSRRHTRFSRDWSSDVCSSDLGIEVDVVDLSNDPAKVPLRVSGYYQKHRKDLAGMFIPSPNGIHPIITMKNDDPQGIGRVYARSEERRVGKEENVQRTDRR